MEEEEQSQLFTPASRSIALQTAFEDARPPPRLQILDRFANAAPNPYAKYGLEQTCANKFSDPNFFLKEWLDDQERKAEALKAERKARRKARQGVQAEGGVNRVKAKRVRKKKAKKIVGM